MEKRKLASVQYVHNITPIEGADRIECVHVLGWQCVANKGQFQVGDRCVYSVGFGNRKTVFIGFNEKTM